MVLRIDFVMVAVFMDVYFEPDVNDEQNKNWVNNACILSKKNVKPYRRCSYCNLNTTQCLGIQNNIVSIVITLFLLAFLLIYDDIFVRLNIVIIITLIIIFGYRINSSLDMLAKTIYSNNELTKQLKLNQDTLEERVIEKTAELVIAKELAEKANHAKSEFLANMSHELRTPMHGILGYAELGVSTVEDKEGKDSKLFKYFNNIELSGERLLGLLDNLLDLSELEIGVLELHYEKFELNSIVDSVLNESETMLNEKNLQFVIEQSTDEMSLNADKDKVTQVIFNLITNAIQYSDNDEKIIISIDDASLRDDVTKEVVPAISLSVKDKGVEVPIEELTTVFENFVQSSRTDTKAGGTGLGLAIAKKIIDKHQGKIWVESSVEEGTVFSFILPRTSNH